MATIPLLSDAQWAVIEPLLPPVKDAMSRPMRDQRPVAEGAIYRLKAGIRGGTWEWLLARLQADADARGERDWRVSVDSTIARVHQHGATAARRVSGPSSHTGGSVE